jgi:protein gp37
MTARFAGDVRLNKMAKKDYSMALAADGGSDIYVLDKPMLNETGNALVYPFGFEPTLHRYRMDIPKKLKMGNNIFVGAMADIFGTWVPDEWISEVMQVCEENPIHNYLFLTKNPERYQRLNLPDKQNMWYGTSITNEADIDRLNYLPAGHKTFVSIEPLLADIKARDYVNMFKDKVNWIIIGAETGRSKGKVAPSFEWVKDIVLMADEAEIPVFMKESLVPIVEEARMRRAYPEQLRHSEISPKMKQKLYDVCSECKAHLKKSDMITLLARSERGEQPKQFGFMCKKCFCEFCKNLGLEAPALSKLIENADISITLESSGEDENE